MEFLLVLAVVAGAALAAPTEDISAQELQRTKKSYGAAPGYAAPCAGAAPLAPVALYLSAAPQSAGVPHYREDEHKDEKTEQRSYYESPAAVSAGSGAISAAVAPATGAVGVFPSANVGGCAIPLLLSCAPNVVSGHLHGSSGYAAPAYRAHDAEHQKDVRETAEKAWSDAERTVGQHHVPEFQEPHDRHHHHVINNFPTPHHHHNVQF